MIVIPNDVFTKYIAYLIKTGVPDTSYAEYKKWLRYYFDFCDKYPVPEAKSERVRLFAAKLLDKKQSPAQRQRAANAVSLYLQMEKHETGAQKESTSSPYAAKTADPAGAIQKLVSAESLAEQTQPEKPVQQNIPHYFRKIARTSNFNEAGYQEKSYSTEWDEVLEKMAGEIKVRHYSRR